MSSSDVSEVMSIRDDSSDFSLLETFTPTDGDATCMFCEGKYSEDRKGEEWIQCILCKEWAHVGCSGAEVDFFICEFCK